MPMSLIKNVVSRTCLAWCLLLLFVPRTANVQTVYLYGAESGTPGNLYNINPATGQATSIGPIGFGISAMAIHPTTGELYAITAPGGAGQRNLIRIDRNTGQGRVIGNVGLGNFGIADMTFRADATLFAWSENSDDLIRISIDTGAGTVIANAGISTFGSGLAFDAAGTLWLAGNGSSGVLRNVNPVTGLTTIA